MPAEQIRRRGDQRAHRSIAAAAVVVAVTLLGVGVAAAYPRTTPALQPGGPSPIAPGNGPTQSNGPTPPPTQSVRTCLSGDLAYASMHSGVATGNEVDQYSLRSNAADVCELGGSPRVSYLDGQGGRTDLPATMGGSAENVVVAPGGMVSFGVERPGQGAGNITSGPSCVHNGIYPNLALVLADGSLVPLGGNSLTVYCGEIFYLPWQVA